MDRETHVFGQPQTGKRGPFTGFLYRIGGIYSATINFP